LAGDVDACLMGRLVWGGRVRYKHSLAVGACSGVGAGLDAGRSVHNLVGR
jgi:hypothetical protein